MPYVSRHGFGYSVFEHTERGIRSELWVYVALDASVKFAVLKVRNECGRSRQTLGHGIRGMGAGRSAAEIAMHVSRKWTPGAVRFSRGTRTSLSSAAGLPFSTWTMRPGP